MSVYVCSDLHGCLNLLRQIQKFIQKNDIVYCLGDCCDRGPEPWETVKAVLKDSRFIYLKGNHEDMLTHAMLDIIHDPDCVNSFNTQLVWSNGGERTLNEWRNEKYRNDWYKLIKDLPIRKEYINIKKQIIHLSHAGFTPNGICCPTEEDLLWDRNHIFDTWPEEDEFSNEFIIHGHTPVEYLIEDFQFFDPNVSIPEGALRYCNGHKIDIDCGSFYTGKTTLLDLDTFEEYIFKS